MTEDQSPPEAADARPLRRDDVADAKLRHPVRRALMGLLAERGTLTSTEAARELGGSTGLYSFHLRQLARYGLVEEVPGHRGRVKPWRPVPHGAAAHSDVDTARDVWAADMSGLNRGLEDESYRRWLAVRDQVPARWQRDEAFSQVLYLTPSELTEFGNQVRALIAGYRHREERPATRPHGAEPVAVVARLFPLVDPDGYASGPTGTPPPPGS